MVLLLGQYSTGKTTFIRYLLERDFPGARIGTAARSSYPSFHCALM
jgi:GTPase SAR1 family protein